MAFINQKIKEQYPDLAVMKKRENDVQFSGRSLPSFVKDFLLRRYSTETGELKEEELKEYLNTKMPIDYNLIKTRLLNGETINMTTRFLLKPDIASGKVCFTIPDAQIQSNAYIPLSLLEEHKDELYEGEIWGNITLEYIQPEGKKSGFIMMKSFKSFEPYKVDFSYFLSSRKNFTTEEWIDLLIASMEYDPDQFSTLEQKRELISRLLILVEPRLNMIELGPKGTGKSYVYNNISKYAWVVSSGKISRAKLFYNKSTRQFGLMKFHDAVLIDEVSSFSFVDADEVQSIFKSFLEDGKATVDNVHFQSECGIGLLGNIPLSSNMQPKSSCYSSVLPNMFQESATLDRFHGFIEGWKLPRMEVGKVLNGWTLNTEYLSMIFHYLRTCTEYGGLFEELVSYDKSCDLRDLKAVRKLTTAYAKLLFPHITSLEVLSEEELQDFKRLYNEYCLQPAIYRRGIIRQQCHLLDPEFKESMPEFKIV